MPELFSVSELINVAIQEEQTGATFYRAMAERTDDDEFESFLLDTAEMEDEHEQKFKELLEKVGGYEPVGDYQDEYSDYMQYMCAGRIFPVGQDAAQLAEQQADEKQACETAMEMERNTLLFYHELLPFVAEADRHLLDTIIAEERQHVTDFARFRREHF